MIPTATPDYWNHTRDVAREIITKRQNITIPNTTCNFVPCPRTEIFWIGVWIGILLSVLAVLIAYMVYQMDKRDKEREEEEDING